MAKEQKSKLDVFTADLDEWFGGPEKVTLAEAKDRLQAKGLGVSLQQLSNWWAKRRAALDQARLLGDITTGAKHCREIEAQFGKSPAPEISVLLKLHRVLILQLSTKAAIDPDLLDKVSLLMKPLIEMEKLDEKRRENNLAERRVAVLEENRARAKAELQKLRDPKAALPEEDRKAIVDKVDEILGLK